MRDQLGNPRLVILAQGEVTPLNGAAYNLLSEHFSKIGFNIRRTTAASLQEVTIQDADVVITVSAQASTNPTSVDDKLFSSRVTLGMEAYLVSTNQYVAQPSPITSDPKVSTNEDTAAAEALKSSLSSEYLDEFVSQLVSGLNATVQTGTAIQVILRGLPSFQAFRAMKVYLESISGVEKVQDRPFSAEEAIFEVQGATLRSDDLAIGLKSFPELKFKIITVDSFKVEAEVAP